MGNHLMRRLWMAGTAGLMVLGAASSARADEKVVAKVPFEFIVGNLRMPAGTYVLTQDTEHSLVSIANRDRKHFTFVLTNPITGTGERSNPELIFDKVGDNHFLARIINQDNEGREIPLTPAVMQREVDRVAAVAAP
jgi:hypothetical protein